ncbi:MAG: lysophospholipid acyltransferase family protein [Kiritimatiellae bacterium]|nr:lysophospholipid acyltransferase family protein [Kiritimatiellia bacterium]
MVGYWANLAAAFLSRRLPLPFSYWLGMRVADLFCLADPAGRRGVRANLRRILAARGIHPARGAIRTLARKTYQAFGKYIVDFYRYSRAFCDELERKVSVAHGERLDRAIAAGRGVILATAHLGSWEMGGLFLASRGHRVTAVYRPTGVPHLDRLWSDHRLQRGIRILPLGDAAAGLCRALQQGELIALLADRDFTGRGAPVDFFGAPVRMPIGPAVLAKRCDAPILPGFMLRQVDERFLLQFHEPIWPREHASVAEIHARLVRVLEDVIGDHPTQWFVFRDFWTTAEPGAARAK